MFYTNKVKKKKNYFISSPKSFIKAVSVATINSITVYAAFTLIFIQRALQGRSSVFTLSLICIS